MPVCRFALAHVLIIAGLILAAGCAAPRRTGPSAPIPPLKEAPRRYVCYRAAGPIAIDGRLDDPPWTRAAWSEPFVDIEGRRHPRPRFRTQLKMTWDDEYFYIAAQLDEPHVWATLTQHDEIVFYDNDFEVFIDPDGDAREYYEIEVNALNTIFDLLLMQTYRAGGPAKHDWNLADLKSAVYVDGLLNHPSGTDRGWSVEMALPWSSLARYAHRPAPPEDGDTWRVNFSRVEWRSRVVDGRYEKVPNTPEDNWVWSPQGLIDMHVPERWGYVEFRMAKSE